MILPVVAVLVCIAGAAPSAPVAPAGAQELSVDVLIEQVLARNPTLTQMAAAADAAAARNPQAVSLEDPIFAATISPRLFGSHDMDGGYRVELSQKYPSQARRITLAQCKGKTWQLQTTSCAPRESIPLIESLSRTRKAIIGGVKPFHAAWYDI